MSLHLYESEDFDLAQRHLSGLKPREPSPLPRPVCVPPLGEHDQHEEESIEAGLAILVARRDLTTTRNDAYTAAMTVWQEAVAVYAVQLRVARHRREEERVASEKKADAVSPRNPTQKARFKLQEREEGVKGVALQGDGPTPCDGTHLDEKVQPQSPTIPNACANCWSSGRLCQMPSPGTGGDASICSFCDEHNLACTNLQVLSSAIDGLRRQTLLLAALPDFIESLLDPRVPQMPSSLRVAFVAAGRELWKSCHAVDSEVIAFWEAMDKHRADVEAGVIARFADSFWLL